MSIYPALAIHQRVEKWGGREAMEILQDWADRFIVEFKLDIPEVVLCLDRLAKDRYAHFRNGHNGFGLRGEIVINTRYSTDVRELWQVLGTLLHEMLHGWQQAHGTPGKRNHHNAEFRQKALELGLVIDARGITGYSANSPFKRLLCGHGIAVPSTEYMPVRTKVEGKSKLKKWSCCCTPPLNVRVAIKNFRARCLICNCEFVCQSEQQTDIGNS